MVWYFVLQLFCCNNMWTNLPPWPYTFCAGTKSTRSRHEKSWAVTKFFMDSSLLYFHSGLKYLVPAQAIIIGFRTVLVPSQAIPSRPLPCFVPTWAVLCRYRPASSLSYFLSVSVPARNRHEKSWVDPSHAVLKNDTKKCGHSGKLLHICVIFCQIKLNDNANNTPFLLVLLP